MLVLFSHINQRFERRNVGFLSCFAYAAFIFVIVVVIMVCADVKEPVAFEMDVLMYFEI